MSTSRLRIRVSIIGSEPEIWRLLEVDAALTLDQVHDVLQIAFQWRNLHLHSFSTEDESVPAERGPVVHIPRSWVPQQLLDDGHQGLDETGTAIERAFAASDGALFYEYDFGDSWTHRIELIEAFTNPSDDVSAVLVRGERRGPLEDSGGIHGYEQMLAVLENPADPEFAEVTGWVSEVVGPWQQFDPGTFSIEDVAAELNRLADPPPATSVVDRVAEGMYPPARAEFRSLVRRALSGPSSVDPEVAKRMTLPFAWLIQRVGADGLKLTAAGWLPPAVVTQAMSELGWKDRWYGKFNREDHTAPIMQLRASVQRLRLVRKLKGRLVLGATAKRVQGDPAALWSAMAAGLANGIRADIESHATVLLAVDVASGRLRAREEYAESVAFGLGMLGWRIRDGVALDSRDVSDLIRDTWHLFVTLGVFEVEGRWRDVTGVTPEGMAFARAVLAN